MKKQVKKKTTLKKQVSRQKAKAEVEEKTTRLIGLESLKPPRGSHKKRKYLGRGSSSGHGKTSTRGSKGQTSRAGRDFYAGFEGGQTPLIRRIPKRGFYNPTRKVYQVVNLKDLKEIKETEITPQVLEDNGLIKSCVRLTKILGEGEVGAAITVKANAFSKSALEKIQKAGGKAEIITIK